MDFTPIQSSTLDAVAYDPEKRELSVRFKSGGTYHYSNVLPESHQALMSAASPGSWLRDNIVKKPNTHPYRKSK